MPGNSRFIVNAFNEATLEKHSYMHFDLSQQQDERFRIMGAHSKKWSTSNYQMSKHYETKVTRHFHQRELKIF